MFIMIDYRLFIFISSILEKFKLWSVYIFVRMIEKMNWINSFLNLILLVLILKICEVVF